MILTLRLSAEDEQKVEKLKNYLSQKVASRALLSAAWSYIEDQSTIRKQKKELKELTTKLQHCQTVVKKYVECLDQLRNLKLEQNAGN
jgi:uncharacterized membrane-anchored protein YjiN (DUF445 family)